MALRLDWRLIAFAAVVAELPDLDHLWGSGMRSALHTAWFLVFLPSAVAAAGLWWQALDGRLRRFLAATPVLLLTHMLLDLFPQASEESSRLIPLLWPLDDRLYQVAPLVADAARPSALSSMGVVVFLLAIAASVGYLAPTLAFWLEREGRRSWWVALAYGLWWPTLLLALLLAKVVRPA